MKTKKEIYQWWVSRGDIENEVDDLTILCKELDKKHCYTNSTRRKEVIAGKNVEVRHIQICKSGWKFPLYLDFIDNECVRIGGF